ncbi:hypothetical protein [Taibaiella koreensis]|uniref:hypothetical protein n=1 Tax=Taibaiella koreensis TaxID=1268548 RepID=UPI000E59B201|nr:hypothetical protein [Taibaiella koreensis]
MSTLSLRRAYKLPGRLLLGTATLALTSYLFYSDEGYYDFRWMGNPGNWIAFILYFVLLLAPQIGLHELALYIYPGGRRRTMLSLLWAALISLVPLYVVFR